MRTVPLAVLLALIVSTSTAWEAYPVLTSDRAYFEHVQKAILADDVAWISKQLVGYPFTVNFEESRLKIWSPEDLKKRSNAIFTSKLKEAVRNQSSNELFKNWQGIMVGNGEIWISEIGETNKNQLVWVYRIIAINVPQSTETVKPSNHERNAKQNSTSEKKP